MALLAPLLIAVVLFYWLAFCLTVAAWLKAIGHLFGGNFIRAALWFNLGVWLLFWWTDKLDNVNFWSAAITITGLGIAGTIGRYCMRRQQAKLAIPTMPTWTPPKTPANDNQLVVFSLHAKREG